MRGEAIKMAVAAARRRWRQFHVSHEEFAKNAKCSRQSTIKQPSKRTTNRRKKVGS